MTSLNENMKLNDNENVTNGKNINNGDNGKEKKSNNNIQQRKALAPIGPKVRTNIPIANIGGKRQALGAVSKNFKEKINVQKTNSNVNNNNQLKPCKNQAVTKKTSIVKPVTKISNSNLLNINKANQVKNEKKKQFTIYCDETLENNQKAKINDETNLVNDEKKTEQIIKDKENVEKIAEGKENVIDKNIDKENLVHERKVEEKVIDVEKKENEELINNENKNEIMAIDELTIDEKTDETKLDTVENDSIKMIDETMTEINENDVKDISMNESKTSISFDQMLIDYCQEYTEDIHLYLLDIENKHRPDPLYMPKQQEVTGKMRCILVDWMIEVSDEYKLSDETLFLAVSFIDRFLSSMSIARSSFQLLGASSLFISSKYEEIYPPDVHEFVYITADSYSIQQVLSMEKLMLKVLHFDLSSPTSSYFLRKYITFLNFGKHVECMAQYYCYLTLLDESFIKFNSSEIAVASIIMASHVFDLVDTKLDFYSSALITLYANEKNRDELIAKRFNIIQECIRYLYDMQKYSDSNQAIPQKFSSDKYACVASYPQKDSIPYAKHYF